MSFEIERKFLVAGDAWRTQVKDRIGIRQAYLTYDGKASIRVRIRDNGGATLTIKSRGAERRRLELEYPVPVLEAEALIALRRGSLIEKCRHLVPYAGAIWEVDVFAGENTGLIIAEIELGDEHQIVELPPWVGPEVTGQPQYYNSSLAQNPYRSWAEVRGAAAGASS
jgi:adenylate cyclase